MHPALRERATGGGPGAGGGGPVRRDERGAERLHGIDLRVLAGSCQLRAADLRCAQCWFAPEPRAHTRRGQPGAMVVCGVPGAQAGVHGTASGTAGTRHRSRCTADHCGCHGSRHPGRLGAVPGGGDAVHAAKGTLVFGGRSSGASRGRRIC